MPVKCYWQEGQYYSVRHIGTPVIFVVGLTKEYSTRTSFSLPPRLLQELDEVTKVMGYEERSRTIQMAIRNLITENELSTKRDAMAVGTIIVLYNHEKKGIDEKLNDVGHDFIKSIISSLHVHLDKEQCLSVIVAKCEVETMLKLERELRGVVGITQLKFSYLVPTLRSS
jgi:CopG family nickel-responsive transcriptional regulator